MAAGGAVASTVAVLLVLSLLGTSTRANSYTTRVPGFAMIGPMERLPYKDTDTACKKAFGLRASLAGPVNHLHADSGSDALAAIRHLCGGVPSCWVKSVNLEAEPCPVAVFNLKEYGAGAGTDCDTRRNFVCQLGRKSSAEAHGSAGPGVLMCEGARTESEVIYWKSPYADAEYVSAVSPHHGEHYDRYLTFEFDMAGLNNWRMVLESVLVLGHALGRTVVLPQQEELWAQDRGEGLGAAPVKLTLDMIYELGPLRKQRGFFTMPMGRFLEKEGVTGGLHDMLPPRNSTQVAGAELREYLRTVADAMPHFGTNHGMGGIPSLGERFIALPANSSGPWNVSETQEPDVLRRLGAFGDGRGKVFYDEEYHTAHHIHIPDMPTQHRLLEHFYGHIFFADKQMQWFYRRFVRDYLRYADHIQCAAAAKLAAVRAAALKDNPQGGGQFYALHIRRGDFHIPKMVISAEQIVTNLVHKNGTAIIPPGSTVFIATDDPDGLCHQCHIDWKLCTSFSESDWPPEGCPKDPSFKAFTDAGWKVHISQKEFEELEPVKAIHPKLRGALDAIVCSRAVAFAGTWGSTLTAYVHRLRGYHGLDDTSYFHSPGEVHSFNDKKTNDGRPVAAHGWWREWPAAWTDDDDNRL